MTATGIGVVADPSGTRRRLEDRGLDVERVTAAVAVAALGIQQSVTDGVSVGVVVAILLAPVWAGSFRRYRLGPLVLWITGLALANGIVLTLLRGTRLATRQEGITGASLLVELAAGVGLLLWARTVLRPASIAAWFGLGLTAYGIVNAAPGTNIWKYAIGMPVSVLVLGLAAYTRRVWASVAALAALAGLSLVFGARAFFAALVLCAVVYLWSKLPRFSRSRSGWAGVVLMLLAVAGAMYLLLSQLLVSGLLGTAAAERSQAQVTESGNLLLGGRPEIAATWALFQHRPVGFGFGVAPSQLDVNAAKTGMVAINYDPNNGYVETYMFGGRIELHSVMGDLWAIAGFGGLLLTAAVIGYTLYVVGREVASREGTAVVLFAAVWTLWNVPFSPLVGAVPVLVLLVGLTLDPLPGTAQAGEEPAPTASGGDDPDESDQHESIPRVTRPDRPALGNLPADDLVSGGPPPVSA